jgi:1-aminocyclopropane-1-carboxylate deaminase/D-cysteine desulfhydrase-like pyridoxal-dependent ACC family enzyme
MNLLPADLACLTDGHITPLQKINHPLFCDHGIELFIKREDLVHPQISGNKWYKLKYNLAHARQQGFKHLVSFGGAFSNHLHALAFAGHQFGFETTGFVRGEILQPLNPTLADAVAWGMTLHSLTRSEYRQRHDPEFVQQLITPHQPCFVIPEGAANDLALLGCGEIVTTINQQLDSYDYICVPCGSGATLAGIVLALENCDAESAVQALGFSALKGHPGLADEVSSMLGAVGNAQKSRWQIVDEFHCGGFGKITPELVLFMRQWREQTGLILEPLYTGKMLLGLCTLVRRGFFNAGTKIVVVHTGGLQGLRGMQAQMDRVEE